MFNWFADPSGERRAVCRKFNAAPGGAACPYTEHSCRHMHGCMRCGLLGHGVHDDVVLRALDLRNIFDQLLQEDLEQIIELTFRM